MIARIVTWLLVLALIATVPVGTALAASDCRATAATMADGDGADGHGGSGDCDECGSKPSCDAFCVPLCHAIAQSPAVMPVAPIWNEPAPIAVVVELLLKSAGPEPPPPRTSLLA